MDLTGVCGLHKQKFNAYCVTEHQLICPGCSPAHANHDRKDLVTIVEDLPPTRKLQDDVRKQTALLQTHQQNIKTAIVAVETEHTTLKSELEKWNRDSMTEIELQYKKRNEEIETKTNRKIERLNLRLEQSKIDIDNCRQLAIRLNEVKRTSLIDMIQLEAQVRTNERTIAQLIDIIASVKQEALSEREVQSLPPKDIQSSPSPSFASFDSILNEIKTYFNSLIDISKSRELELCQQLTNEVQQLTQRRTEFTLKLATAKPSEIIIIGKEMENIDRNYRVKS